MTTPAQSPHRCNTLLCGAPATHRRQRWNAWNTQIGWTNCCAICFTRNQHDKEDGWEEIAPLFDAPLPRQDAPA